MEIQSPVCVLHVIVYLEFSVIVDRTSSVVNPHIFQTVFQNPDAGNNLINTSRSGRVLQLEQKWNSRNISFDLEIEDVKVRGNRSLLKEVWVNLIDNAIKFSPKNSIISISAYSNGKDMVFAIEDRGEGMDEATCDKIFDKFYQGDTSHATEGNGLGLSLVRKIVELHHGSIKVKSQPGRGSIFVVMLPLEG